MRNHTRSLLVALVVLAVLLVPAGTAIAQDAPGAPNGTQAQNETNTSAPATNATANETGNESENESDGGALGGRLGGFSLSMYEAESPVCEDMNAASAFTCDSVIGLLLAGGEAVMEFYVAVQTGLIRFIVDRPGAMQGGEMSFYGTPDNQPMTAVHGYWLDKTFPVSICLWAVLMIANLLSGILPFGANSRYGQARAFETGVVVFFGILMSWFLGNLILHAVFGITATFAPGPESLSTDPQVAQADSAAAVIGALALYLGYGVAAVLALLMFAITWLGLYVLLPSLPLAMVLKQPKIWILQRVNRYGDKIFDLFLTCALWPVPTAIILGLGYPLTAEIAVATPDFLAFVPGVAPTQAAALGVLRLGVWIAALLAPLFIFMLSSPSAAVMGAAGALSLGAASGGAAGAATGAASGTASGSASALASGAGSASALPAGASRAASTIGTDPIKGTSLSADAVSASSAGALPSGSGSLASAGQSSSTGSVARAAASDTTSSGTTAGTASGDTSSIPGGDVGTTADESGGVTRVTDRAEFDGSQRYEYGYQKGDGDFQVIENHTVRGDSLVDNGLATRVQDVYDDRDLLLRDPDSGELMDVSEIAARDRDVDTQLSPDVQSQQSRDTVYGTRDETPN